MHHKTGAAHIHIYIYISVVAINTFNGFFARAFMILCGSSGISISKLHNCLHMGLSFCFSILPTCGVLDMFFVPFKCCCCCYYFQFVINKIHRMKNLTVMLNIIFFFFFRFVHTMELRAHACTLISHIYPCNVDIFYTLKTECLFFVVFGVETPMTASFPSRNGANKCVFPGVTTIVWIGICSGISKTGFNLFIQIQLHSSSSRIK